MADALLRPKVVQVSTLELEREGKSYTSDTLEELHRQYPEAELWLLMGTDMFLTLHLWHDPDSILRLGRGCAPLAVLNRTGRSSLPHRGTSSVRDMAQK